jgi:hypothetical protein
MGPDDKKVGMGDGADGRAATYETSRTISLEAARMR